MDSTNCPRNESNELATVEIDHKNVPSVMNSAIELNSLTNLKMEMHFLWVLNRKNSKKKCSENCMALNCLTSEWSCMILKNCLFKSRSCWFDDVIGFNRANSLVMSSVSQVNSKQVPTNQHIVGVIKTIIENMAADWRNQEIK